MRQLIPPLCYLLLMLYLTSCSMPGGSEWIWIVAVVLILFGGRKIPELMKGIGKGIREFNHAKDDIKKEFEEGMNEEEEEKKPSKKTSSKKTKK